MRCYVNNQPCGCQLDDVSKDGCTRDCTDELPDPFRAGDPDDFVEYLNGGGQVAAKVFG